MIQMEKLMKNRTKFAAVAIALMASSTLALMPGAGTPGASVDAKVQFLVDRLHPGNFDSYGDWLMATTPWPGGGESTFRSIMSY